MNRRALWAWVAAVVPLWFVLVVCVYWEPVVRDGWSNYQFARETPMTPHIAWELLKNGWLGSNPRLGQTVTTLLYAPGPYHVIITPLLELALFTMLTAITLGRWPSVRRADDALVFVTVTAMFALCTPQLGPMLFYRPFFGNYLIGLLLNLLWLAPYRFHADQPRSWRAWWSPLMLVLGIAAGMCNEHTGPAFIAAAALAVAWSLRRGDRLRPWMVAGLVGLIAGYVLLMVAPGHDARYGGLAKQAGMLGRFVERGVGENLKIVGALVRYVAWSLPWVVLGIVARRRGRPGAPRPPQLAYLVLAGAGVLACLALYASPKIGMRLYVHSIGLIAIAITGWVISQLTTVGTRTACAVLSALVLAYVAFRCVDTYRQVGPASEHRIAIIQHAAPGSHVVVPRYPRCGHNWFLGEDFEALSLRSGLVADYKLGSLELAPR